MSAEFVDTNVLIYAHAPGSGSKQSIALDLIQRLFLSATGALSTQVLVEFYAAAVRLGIPSQEAEQIITDLSVWILHRPAHSDLLQAIRLQRRYRISWWDALVIQSASELGCQVLWTEDLTHGHKYGGVTVKNPFR